MSVASAFGFGSDKKVRYAFVGLGDITQEAMLPGVAHTGNSLASHKAYPAYRGDGLYRDQPKAVSDGGIITAPGSAPVSFAVEILKSLGLFGPEAEAELQVFAAEHR